jgi:hypothetical protein
LVDGVHAVEHERRNGDRIGDRIVAARKESQVGARGCASVAVATKRQHVLSNTSIQTRQSTPAQTPRHAHPHT